MVATSRLKQLLFIIAALALVSLGLVAALSTASPARADDTQPCVETEDSYTDWVNEGDATQTLANTPPGADTNTVRYLPAGTVQVGNGDAVEATPDHFENLAWFIWTGGPRDAAPDSGDDGWHGPQPNVPNGAPHTETPGVYSTSDAQGRGSWFKLEGDFVAGTPGQDETFHTEYRWQKQVRTFVEGNDCPPPAEKKVYVCKYVGTPGVDEVLQSGNNPIEVSVNSIIPGFAGDPADLIGQAFADGQVKSVVIAVSAGPGGGQGDEPTIDDCPAPQGPPEECPDGQIGTPPNCVTPDPGPDACPVGTDKVGQEIPADQTEEEFCDEDDEEDVCPQGTDNAGQEIPGDESEESFCDDDDVNPGPNCEEDPSQPRCDENKPPVVGPNDGNSPSNGPTVKGASATAPTAVAGTPAARVPTSVNAGLGSTQQELTGTGGGLGLLGIAAALFGAALVGMTFRPRRGRTLVG